MSVDECNIYICVVCVRVCVNTFAYIFLEKC